MNTNRICPSEETLSEYLSGVLITEERSTVETHLAGCRECRQTLNDAYDVLKKPDMRHLAQTLFTWIRANRWLVASATTLILSFLIPKYFLQLLTASLLTGAKWIVDSKTTKMLIMIHEAWKTGNKEKTDQLLSSFKK